MTPTEPTSCRALPTWLIAVGSLSAAAHCFLVLAGALARPSGPWYSMTGPGLAEPPAFAKNIARAGADPYLQALRLAEEVGGLELVPAQPGVILEVRLRDREGRVFKVLRLPDESANALVRHRQGRLVRALAPDLPVAPRPGEMIPAPGQDPVRVPIWETIGDRRLRLEWRHEHLIPRQRDVWRPSDWSLTLVRSMTRRLCREHGADSAEAIRITREAIRPETVLLASEAPPMEDLVAHYGEFRP